MAYQNRGIGESQRHAASLDARTSRRATALRLLTDASHGMGRSPGWLRVPTSVSAR